MCVRSFRAKTRPICNVKQLLGHPMVVMHEKESSNFQASVKILAASIHGEKKFSELAAGEKERG